MAVLECSRAAENCGEKKENHFFQTFQTFLLIAIFDLIGSLSKFVEERETDDLVILPDYLEII